MTERLPSVNSLRAFVAAARHSSFKKAAAELHVTPAAISHQVKALEEDLGVQLFRRFPNGLELTQLGKDFLPGLERGFEQLAVTVDQLRQATRHNRLDVAVAPSFAAKWLLPRLHGFIEKHPHIDVRISAAENLIERNTADRGQPTAGSSHEEPQDVAIAFGRGDYPGFRVDELFSTSLALFCAPQLLRGAHPLRHPDDLRYQTLLHDDTPFFSGDPSNWNVWFEHASPGAFDASRRVHFSHAVLALDAAVDGLGVALSPAPLALLDVAAGRLVVPFGPMIKSESGYYLLTPTGNAERPQVALFREWIMEEARKDDVQLAELLNA
jgi:LysR family transcriptional regulator, glycine cleavage system transcriptional activator